MKLKLIKDSEVVISRKEYGELLKRPTEGCICEKDCVYFNRAILNGNAKYECEEIQGSYYVFISGENSIYPIKIFNSDDIEYNRVCAEELCELLNQEQ